MGDGITSSSVRRSAEAGLCSFTSAFAPASTSALASSLASWRKMSTRTMSAPGSREEARRASLTAMPPTSTRITSSAEAHGAPVFLAIARRNGLTTASRKLLARSFSVSVSLSSTAPQRTRKIRSIGLSTSLLGGLGSLSATASATSGFNLISSFVRPARGSTSHAGHMMSTESVSKLLFRWTSLWTAATSSIVRVVSYASLICLRKLGTSDSRSGMCTNLAGRVASSCMFISSSLTSRSLRGIRSTRTYSFTSSAMRERTLTERSVTRSERRLPGPARTFSRYSGWTASASGFLVLHALKKGSRMAFLNGRPSALGFAVILSEKLSSTDWP
mmetsp:Transcript_23696/g.47290  ORF Transcript_23696/g.47290 Transcript_23696/m.47290 type:complete len:332 (-) Transcript_23696:135-1130(-)